MFRIAETKILTWLTDSRKALLITGARQVGKTYLVRETLKTHEIPFFEINFLDRIDILNTLKGISDIDDFEKKLALYSTQKLSQNSVIFLDEIQEFPEIVTKIKFLVDRHNYRYILSGSMLGVALKSIRSVPIGSIEELTMFPMNIKEFAIALGVTSDTLNYIQECYDKHISVDPIIHQKMLNLFYNYLVVGGLPAVVQKFVNQESLLQISEEQTNIMNFYKADFIKYEMQDKKLKIISIYENIPSQLNKQNLKFIFTYLNKELKFDRYENSFLWLKEAAVSIPVYIAQEAKSPLFISNEKNSFKLFLNDVGLFVNTYPAVVKNELISKTTEAKLNNGALFENYVAQALVENGFSPYYFKNKTIGEVDFLIELNGKVIPLEIKSGKDYRKHSALNNLLDSNEYKIENAFVFSPNNVEQNNRITYLPIYMISFMHEELVTNTVVDYEAFKF